MSWEHQLAKELKKRDNLPVTTWFAGEMVSPIVVSVMPDGKPLVAGPTIVSCFGGEVMLEADRLKQIPKPDGSRYHAGETVALAGHPFSKEPGAQKILILGVVEDVI